MQTVQEIFDNIVGEFHRTLSPQNYINVVKAMQEYARQACEEQKKICINAFKYADDNYGSEANAIRNAPLPELK